PSELKNGEAVIIEGKAKIIFPNKNEVFYNPVQEFNRDLTKLCGVVFIFFNVYLPLIGFKVSVPGEDEKKRVVVNLTDCETGNSTDSGETSGGKKLAVVGEQCQEGIRILEGLAASGLRSIRFAKEVPGIHSIVANDFSAKAVELMKRNVELNAVQHLVTPSLADASLLMYERKRMRERFDIIDLDPYGSPSMFIDGAVQAVSEGVWIAIQESEICNMGCPGSKLILFLRGVFYCMSQSFQFEALRIILHNLEQRANCYQRYIVPLLSISADFYIRVFVRVFTGQAKVKASASKQAMVYNCVGCGAYHLQRLGKMTSHGNYFKYSAASGPPVGMKCEHCQQRHQLGGPVWAEPIHNLDFVHKVLSAVENNPKRFNTSSRILGMLSMVTEELDAPSLMYVSYKISVIHMHTYNPLKMRRSAILHAGYQVSLSHACKNTIKTDAPPAIIWDIMRCWEKKNPVKREKLSETSPAFHILGKEPVLQACFNIRQDANPKSRKRHLRRFQENPEANWGPKAKAKAGGGISLALEDKRKQHQNKRKNRSDDTNNLKGFPCKKFKEGSCSLGEDCRYSHQLEPEEKPPAEPEEKPPAELQPRVSSGCMLGKGLG
uniref:tRNA (guanine(26)-N(2))-dimethyltransferase n=1 Tax=Latimeria chalumnae TaxID=7897 RepID=H3B3T1_LATCH